MRSVVRWAITNSPAMNMLMVGVAFGSDIRQGILNLFFLVRASIVQRSLEVFTSKNNS